MSRATAANYEFASTLHSPFPGSKAPMTTGDPTALLRAAPSGSGGLSRRGLIKAGLGVTGAAGLRRLCRHGGGGRSGHHGLSPDAAGLAARPPADDHGHRRPALRRPKHG